MATGRSHAPARNRALDGLRAIAALSVLGYHAAAFTGHSPHSLVLAQLKAGVAIFFVISGCVLYLPYARTLAGGGRLPSWREHAIRRLARIVPGFWGALIVWSAVFAAAGASQLVGRPGDLWRYFAFVQTYHAQTVRSGYGVSWSLCVELAFYLVLPLLARTAARLGAFAQARSGGAANPATVQLVMCALLAVVSLDFRLAFSPALLGPVPVSREVIATSLPALFDWFAIGIALAVCATEWQRGASAARALRALASRPGVSVTLGVALLGAATPLQGGDIFLPNDSPVAHILIGLGAAFLVAPTVVPRSGPRRSAALALLGSRPLAWLGTISYGIYLYQVLAIILLRHLEIGAPLRPALSHMTAGPSLLLFASAVVAAIGLGACSWYLIERPANRWAVRRLATARATGAVAVNVGPEPSPLVAASAPGSS